MHNEFAGYCYTRGEALLYLERKCARYGGEATPTNKEERDSKNPP